MSELRDEIDVLVSQFSRRAQAIIRKGEDHEDHFLEEIEEELSDKIAEITETASLPGAAEDEGGQQETIDKLGEKYRYWRRRAKSMDELSIMIMHMLLLEKGLVVIGEDME